MILAQKSISVGKRRPLVRKLLIVEGISRAGKFLLSIILNGFKGVEPGQLRDVLDHVPFLYSSGFIEKTAAQEILKCEIDMNCYDMLLGRALNYRFDDKSCIFNNPRHQQYFKRSKEKNRDKVLRKFLHDSNYSTFIVHELMPVLRLYLDTFPQMKVISLIRDPVSLVYSWYVRQLNNRLGEDPKLFVIPFQNTAARVFPWYISGKEKEYLALSPMDKTILSIETLFSLYKNSYKKLSLSDKKKILFVNFESLVVDTPTVINQIKRFLKKPILPEMSKILKKEHLPNPKFFKERGIKLEVIKRLSSAEYFNRLIKLDEDYW